MPANTTVVNDTEITVVIVTYRGAELLPSCLAGLRRQRVPFRLLVVDNDSTDGTAAVLRELLPTATAGTVLRLDSNRGFAGGVAAALALVTTRFCALLNDDAIPDPDWLEKLLAVAIEDPQAAAWTPLLVLADAETVVNNFGASIDARWYGVDVDAGRAVAEIGPDVVDVFGFSGGAPLLRTDAVRAVGGFPAEFFMYYEDLDTSWRLRLAGWSIRAVPAARVVHGHAVTSDPRSAMFHFHNERNRLLTLIRCAPAAVAPMQYARFLLTTGSLALKKLLHRPVPDAQNFRFGLRFKVAVAVAAQAPKAYLRRSAVGVNRHRSGRREPAAASGT